MSYVKIYTGCYTRFERLRMNIKNNACGSISTYVNQLYLIDAMKSYTIGNWIIPATETGYRFIILYSHTSKGD